MVAFVIMLALLAQGTFARQFDEINNRDDGVIVDGEKTLASDISPAYEDDFATQDFGSDQINGINLAQDFVDSERAEHDTTTPNFQKFELNDNQRSNEIPDSLEAKETQIDVMDNDEQIVPSNCLSPEQQIAALKQSMERLNAAVTQEFEKLATDCLNLKTRSKRDVTGNKPLMRLLKHIRATNEKQSGNTDNIMSAEEIALKFGIELNPEVESNMVAFESIDKSKEAEPTEQIENVESHIHSGEMIENTANQTTVYEETSTEDELTTAMPTTTETEQQYYYEVPHYQENPQIFKANDGAYYYYQIEPTPPQETTPNPEEVIPETDSLQTELPQSPRPEPLATEYAAEPMYPQQAYSERPNPFYNIEETPISYRPYSENMHLSNVSPQMPAAQPQVVMMMSPVETQQTDVTEQLQEITSEDVAVSGDGSRLQHFHHSSYHRLAHTNHAHDNIATLPQQFQYYFSLV